MSKIIKSDKEKEDLLGDMVNFQRQVGMSALDWVDHLKLMLIKMPATWTLATHNEPFKEEYIKLWIENYGEWRHCNRRTKAHNNLGMAYGWWTFKELKTFSDFKLSDAPDFKGKIVGKQLKNRKFRVAGDIGQCTPSAICNGIKSLCIHDLWISVLDWNTHIIIEFGYNPSKYYEYHICRAFSSIAEFNVPVLEQIKDVFFCKYCNEWTITKSSIEEIAKVWVSQIDCKNKSESRKIIDPIIDKCHQLSLWDEADYYS